MNKEKMIELMEDNPVILGLKTVEDLSLVRENEAEIVMTLCGSISTIVGIINELKKMGKTVFVNIDMVDGLASKNSVVDFMKLTKADGIVSSKANLLRYARQQGFFTIHRFFVLDSSAWQNISKQLDISQPDIINIAPGWTKIIRWTAERFSQPIISSGLVCDKDIVIENLNAGAIAICTTNHDVWNM